MAHFSDVVTMSEKMGVDNILIQMPPQILVPFFIDRFSASRQLVYYLRKAGFAIVALSVVWLVGWL